MKVFSYYNLTNEQLRSFYDPKCNYNEADFYIRNFLEEYSSVNKLQSKIQETKILFEKVERVEKSKTRGSTPTYDISKCATLSKHSTDLYLNEFLEELRQMNMRNNNKCQENKTVLPKFSPTVSSTVSSIPTVLNTSIKTRKLETVYSSVDEIEKKIDNLMMKEPTLKHNQNNKGESLLKIEADQGISFNKYKNYRNGDSNNFNIYDDSRNKKRNRLKEALKTLKISFKKC